MSILAIVIFIFLSIRFQLGDIKRNGINIYGEPYVPAKGTWLQFASDLCLIIAAVVTVMALNNINH